MYTVHTQNLLPSTMNMGKVPVQTWTGHQYTQYTTTHLHPFGSTAYVDVISWNGHGVLEAAVVNGVLLPSIALNCLPGCCTRMFNCSGILD
jgi:hypothetical protein